MLNKLFWGVNDCGLLSFSGHSLSAPVRGFWIVSDLSLGATMICITSTYECLLLPLLYGSVWFHFNPVNLGDELKLNGLMMNYNFNEDSLT